MFISQPGAPSSSNRRPVEELAAPVLADLHTERRELWERVKRTELGQAGEDDTSLQELLSLIHVLDDELQPADIARTMIHVRQAAIAEAVAETGT